MFVDPRKSTIDVTQCVGRYMRLHLNKNICSVIIPIPYDEVVEEHNFSSIISILTAMNEIDDTVIEYFTTKERKGSKIKIMNMDILDLEYDTVTIKYVIDNLKRK